MAAAEVPSDCREQLSAMILELRANRLVLGRLSKQCAMFRFTGGTIPPETLNICSMASHLSPALGGGCIATNTVERYRDLIRYLAGLQLEAASVAGPRTLRARCAITDDLNLAISEILKLTNHLELGTNQALESVDPQSSVEHIVFQSEASLDCSQRNAARCSTEVTGE